MRRRGFFILAAATVVLFVLAVIAASGGNRAITQVASGEKALPAIGEKLADLSWVRLTHGATKINLARIGASWFVVDKGNYPATPGKVRQTLLALADLTLAEPKTDRSELYPRLEIGDPANGKSTLIEVKDKTGTTVGALIVGKRRYDRLGAGNDGVYVRKPGDSRAWLARGSLDLSGDPPSWLDRHVLDIPDTRIASVTLTDVDGATLAIARTKEGDPFAVQNPPADAKLKSATVIGEPANALQTLDFDDVKPAAELPVPADGVVTAAFTTFDGLTVHFRLFTHDKADWVAIDASGSGKAEAESKQIDAKVVPWAYAIPAFKAKMLRTKLADLIEPPKGS